MRRSPPADWQLPPGVNRGLWDYLHDSRVARNYDATVQGSSLCQIDLAFVAEHCSPPGRLLDLGCGTGRLLIPRAKQGSWVLGVDLSTEMLAVAREKAAREGVEVALLQANLTDLRCLAQESFDHAACLFSTLGMVIGAENRKAVVAQVYQLLKPGGVFVLHVHNRWFNVWNRGGLPWVLGDLLGGLVSGREGGDRKMPVHQGIAGLVLHLFTRREAGVLLREAGFRLREVRPVSLHPDGRLPVPMCFPTLRSYGYLIAAEKPG
jgi:SAM-dependent methyltransferase